jgi:hypothetical protein
MQKVQQYAQHQQAGLQQQLRPGWHLFYGVIWHSQLVG